MAIYHFDTGWKWQKQFWVERERGSQYCKTVWHRLWHRQVLSAQLALFANNHTSASLSLCVCLIRPRLTVVGGEGEGFYAKQKFLKSKSATIFARKLCKGSCLLHIEKNLLSKLISFCFYLDCTCLTLSVLVVSRVLIWKVNSRILEYNRIHWQNTVICAFWQRVHVLTHRWATFQCFLQIFSTFSCI